MELDFRQPVHNPVFQEISSVENELSLFDMVDIKGIVCNIGALERAKGNKLLGLKKASIKNSTG